MKEYLVEITQKVRCWIKASNVEEAKEISVQEEECNNEDAEICNIKVIDEREYFDDCGYDYE